MIRIADHESWQRFLVLADIEGWRLPEIESRLFLGDWRPYAKILEYNDTFCGSITAVIHQQSGWIGNLIVPKTLRGMGYGSQLFAAALESMKSKDPKSIWLTASEMGQSLYEKHGFDKVDEVERWVALPGDRVVREPDPATVPGKKLREADQKTWGEDRSFLLDALVGRGTVFACDDSVALLQHEPRMEIVGPWYSPKQSLHANRRLLHKIMAATDPDLELVVDMLASSPVKQLLPAAGFSCVGKNALMAKGEIAQIDLSSMVALASLGSIG